MRKRIRDLPVLEQIALACIGAGLAVSAVGGCLCGIESLRLNRHIERCYGESIRSSSEIKRVYGCLAVGGLSTTGVGVAAYGASLIVKGLKKE